MRRKNLFIYIPFLIVFLSSFLICGISDLRAEEDYSDLSPDMQRIMQRGKLIVGLIHVDDPPFFMYNEKNELIGFDIDLATNIAKKLGVEVEFNREAKTHDGVVDLVLDKKIDVAISCLSSTLKRGQKVMFTDPYLTLYRTVLINRVKAAEMNVGIDTKKCLNVKGATIGTLRGSAYVEYSDEDFPNAKIILYDKWSKLLDDVYKGKILALLYDDVAIQNYLKMHPVASLRLKMIIEKDEKDPISMAVHWGDLHLLVWLNQYLIHAGLNGTLDELIIKYFKEKNWLSQ